MALDHAKGGLAKDLTVECGLVRRGREDPVQVLMTVCAEEMGIILRGSVQARQAKGSAAAINHILA